MDVICRYCSVKLVWSVGLRAYVSVRVEDALCPVAPDSVHLRK